MAKTAIKYACAECGYTAGRWFGKCPGCNAFGTLIEEAAPDTAGVAAPKPLLRLVDVDAAEAERIGTGVDELDRVLGGGLVPASLVLVGGEPGVGKSTLLLMALRAMSETRRVVLVTGEESVAQVKLRAARLGGAANVEILAETELETVCATLERELPDVCVIDSVQTLYASELGSAPGSVAQVREAASRLLRVAKENGIARSVGETSAWTSSRSGRVPSSAHATAAPTSPSSVLPNSADGSGTPTRPAPVISKTPSSFVEPKRFLAARRMRCAW